MRQWIVLGLVALIGALGAGYAAFQLSPWPSVLLIRHMFSSDAATRNQALARHVPRGVTARLDIPYGEGPQTRLDVFAPERPTGGAPLPTVVWIHGGAFVAGAKSDVAPYLRILAARGYVTIGVGYALAPGARYPTPVRQVAAAIAHVVRQASAFGVDPSRIVLAGDSAGAQIAAQLAAAVAEPSYAAAVGIPASIPRVDLRGVALMCGVYDAGGIARNGPFACFLDTVMWSYFGTRDLSDDPRLAQFSVARHVRASFPPTFLTVGNADPLAPQTVALGEALRAQGVATDTLFFPAHHEPPLGHEFQFDLDGAAGRLAFERLVAFLARVTAR
jgi:acetyl esterase/lipase